VTDISQALRELLLARAAGQITAEEFERRQAALHAELLAPTAQTPEPVAVAKPAINANPGRSGAWRWLLAAALAASAGGLYLWLGNPAGVGSGPSTSPVPSMPPMTGLPPDGQQAGSGGDLKVMAQRLADKLAKDPGNGEGWALLARTYLELRQHRQAADAFAKADALQKLDATALADWADAYVVASDRKWDAKARDLVKRALAADPKHLKALALAGSEAFERKDYKEAIAQWQKMRAAAPADSMDAKLADTNIEEASAIMTGKRPPAVSALPAAPTSATSAPASAAPAANAMVAGTVTVASALKSRLAPTDTVFIVAKPTDGMGAPLAVKRFTVADLPIKFTLTDQDAMVPDRRLSRFGEVLVTARISKSGDAIAKPGDPASAPLTVKVGSNNLRIEIAP
jgi:cytochrome c-type biogenesis protein CcmH